MISVQTSDFEPGNELEQLRTQCAGKAGAVVGFTGLVRDLSEGAAVRQMKLEHYPGMTEKALSEVEQQARSRWELIDTLIIHRVCPLLPNDRIILVAAASAHRKDAFQACEFMIDTLKTATPFWKKETTPSGALGSGNGRPAGITLLPARTGTQGTRRVMQ